MEWKSEYVTGILEIDFQHKALLQFSAGFEEAVEGKLHWNTRSPELWCSV